MIYIREAIQSDCPRLLELVKELALFEKAPQEVTVSLSHFEESGFGKSPVWWAYVACQKNTEGNELIIGFGLYYIRYSTWKGQSLYLEDLLVTESHRGKGIGKQLFETIIAVCKQKGYKRMCWQVLEWNKPAIDFYKQYGAKLDGEWENGSIDF